MNVATITRSPRLKIRRANRHIDAIIRDSTPLLRELYEITNGATRSVAALAQPNCFDLTYRPKSSVSDHFSPIIGDAVNNLREALDHWANATLKAIGKSDKVHFPFSEEWIRLEKSRNYEAIRKAFPELAKFILEEIRPCRDGNLHLWASTRLCNINKHNDFVPTVTVAKIGNINARIGTNTIRDCTMGGNADSRIGLIRSGTPISIDNNFSTSVEIIFSEGAIFESQPVVPTLLEMSRVVSETLDALDLFIEPYVP